MIPLCIREYRLSDRSRGLLSSHDNQPIGRFLRLHQTQRSLVLLVLVSGWIVTGTWINGGLGMGFQHSVATGIEKDFSFTCNNPMVRVGYDLILNRRATKLK